MSVIWCWCAGASDRVGHVSDALPGVALAALPAARGGRAARRRVRAAWWARGAVRARVGADCAVYARAARHTPATALRLLRHLRARRFPPHSALFCKHSYC